MASFPYELYKIKLKLSSFWELHGIRPWLTLYVYFDHSHDQGKSNRRVAEIQIFETSYLIVIKDETGLNFKINDSTLFLIGSYAQKLVASY